MKKKLLNLLFIIIALVIGSLIGCVCSVMLDNNKGEKSGKTDCPKFDVESSLFDNNKYDLTYFDEVKNSNGQGVINNISPSSVNYNGREIELNNDNSFEDNMYISFSFFDSENPGQCYNYSVLINKRDKTYIEKKYTKIGLLRTNYGYYFKGGTCEPLDYKGNVYDQNWNLLGAYIGNTTLDNGNIYVSKADNNQIQKGIILFDINGKKISELNDYYYTAGVVYNNECYVVAKDNEKIYIINLSTNEKFEVGNVDGERGVYLDYDSIVLNGDKKLYLRLYEGNYYFDLTTKLVTKK